MPSSEDNKNALFMQRYRRNRANGMSTADASRDAFTYAQTTLFPEHNFPAADTGRLQRYNKAQAKFIGLLNAVAPRDPSGTPMYTLKTDVEKRIDRPTNQALGAELVNRSARFPIKTLARVGEAASNIAGLLTVPVTGPLYLAGVKTPWKATEYLMEGLPTTIADASAKADEYIASKNDNNAYSSEASRRVGDRILDAGADAELLALTFGRGGGAGPVTTVAKVAPNMTRAGKILNTTGKVLKAPVKYVIGPTFKYGVMPAWLAHDAADTLLSENDPRYALLDPDGYHRVGVLDILMDPDARKIAYGPWKEAVNDAIVGETPKPPIIKDREALKNMADSTGLSEEQLTEILKNQSSSQDALDVAVKTTNAVVNNMKDNQQVANDNLLDAITKAKNNEWYYNPYVGYGAGGVTGALGGALIAKLLKFKRVGKLLSILAGGTAGAFGGKYLQDYLKNRDITKTFNRMKTK